MNDPVAAFHPLDPGRIDLVDPLECAYWCRELHCSEAQLRAAVERAGSHVAAVREVLERPVEPPGPAAHGGAGEHRGPRAHRA